MSAPLFPSSLLAHMPHDYVDSYTAPLANPHVTIEQVGIAFFNSSPAWVDGLFALRNRIVALFGLKTSGTGEKAAVIRNFKCDVGERVGLFKIFAKNEREIILGEDDKHLDFRVSLWLDPAHHALTVTTIVKFHNALGRLYFLPVKPFHRLIVPAMVRGMVRELEKSGE